MDRAPDLAAVLGMFGFFRHCARQELAGGQEVFETGLALLEMAQRYAAASSWPARPTGSAEILEVAHEMMEERHGPFWLSDFLSQDEDDEEPS